MSSIIYRITNVVNSKFYIGKTSKTVQERFQRHCYNHQNQNTYLYNAMRTLQPHYNMTIGGDGGDTSDSPNYKLAYLWNAR